ncbi:MAG: TraM recognition domain-containing protein [Clostridia bacterium]|nr:TraM recognition domain-containing protein [Clostridia bacterium]
MKLIDKFLKKINASRNTFATYVLTMFSIYIVVDRVVEMLFLIFTGVSVSYWGPIQYTLALACPIFAYLFCVPSEFASSKSAKVTLFFTYVITLYVVAISMITQWINQGAWLFLVSLPGYADLVTNYSELIKPALTSLAIYMPLTTFYGVIKWIRLGVMDSKDQTRSIWDYKGISLADKSKGHGPFSCDIHMCNNYESGKKMIFSESKRYQSLLVCGGSGTGKTAMVLEPMMAKDIEKKAFYKANAKEMGYTALKTGIATLNKPYDNEYLNENFNLNMISPAVGKDAIYKAYLNKMILSGSANEYIYRDLGLTSMSPDYETISKMMDVCKNFHIKYSLIDPSKSDSKGLNPFVYDDTSKIAITISSVLKGMYVNTHPEIEEAYREEFIMQAIENITMILKEMYPRLNSGNIPNLEDMLKMLTNFDLVEKMCEIMKQDVALANKYSIQLAYFEKNFYKGSIGRQDTEKYVYLAASQLDNLLRIPGVKSILCNRHNNVDFDKSLANGEVIFVCTRRGDLGITGHRAFGLFFILSMQNAVLRRPGNENSRIPHFFYMDEFPDFICKDTEAIFTLYRKYKVATTITAQNLAQLEGRAKNMRYKETILSNCANKMFTGNGTPDELAWWEKEFTKRRTWKYSNSMDMNKLEYDSKYGSVKYDWETYFTANKLGTLKAKNFAVKLKKDDGKFDVGQGVFDYLGSKYKEEQPVKKYNFSKFTPGVVNGEDEEDKKKKFDLKNISFSEKGNETNPIQTDTTDATFEFDNENAIVVNFRKKKE